MPNECPKHKVTAVRTIKTNSDEYDNKKGAIKIVTNRLDKNQIDLTGFHLTSPS
jgi:hypothetical protein